MSLEATLEMLGTEGQRGTGAEGHRGRVWGRGCPLCPLAPPTPFSCTLTSRGPCSPSLFFTENRSTSCEAP